MKNPMAIKGQSRSSSILPVDRYLDSTIASKQIPFNSNVAVESDSLRSFLETSIL